jgi:Asp/Glu/hydantoin racemase
LKILIKTGKLNTQVVRAVCSHVQSAQMAGADAVLLTCSSISPCAEAARFLVDIPVLKIDEPMAEQAVSLGRKIGVVATLPTTLEPTVRLIEQKAGNQHKTVTIATTLCEGAFQAVSNGDVGTHDDLVMKGIRGLIDSVDVIVLAQASMARLISFLGTSPKVPILASPRSGIEKAREIISKI